MFMNQTLDAKETVKTSTVAPKRKKRIPIIALDDIVLTYADEVEVHPQEPVIEKFSLNQEHVEIKKDAQPEEKIEKTAILEPAVEIPSTPSIAEPMEEIDATLSHLEKTITEAEPNIASAELPSVAREEIILPTKLGNTVTQDLEKISYDEKPELANLENTIRLNADILKPEIQEEEMEKDEEKSNKKGKIIIAGLFLLLVIFAISIPFIVNYLK